MSNDTAAPRNDEDDAAEDEVEALRDGIHDTRAGDSSDDEQSGIDEIGVCRVCALPTEARSSRVLLCEDCDAEVHLECAGLRSVPKREWRCNNCVALEGG